MRARIAQFMAGRNGNDQFNMFLLVAGLVMMVLSSIIGGAVGRVLSLLLIPLLAFIYFRVFSKNLYKRREENGKYLRVKYRVTSWLRMRSERWRQRRDYRFFSCPACRATMRVPRGRGRISIVCRKCGHSFIRKS